MKIKFKTPFLEVPSSGVMSADLARKHINAAEALIAFNLKGRPRTEAALRDCLEQYYTDERFVRLMMAFIAKHFASEEHLCVEPSAGSGAIARFLPRDSILIDVDEEYDRITKANFLVTRINTTRKIAVIGNPPFGSAVDLFNHAAISGENVEKIAMILPLTFRRESTVRKLDCHFQLVAEMDVPAWAFLCGGAPYNVPATLQIWERRDVKRVDPPEIKSHSDFTFGAARGAAFRFQRVGTNAGRIHDELHRSAEAHLFVKVRRDDQRSYVEAMFNSIDWASVARNTSANPYITRSEIYAEYTKLERVIYG